MAPDQPPVPAEQRATDTAPVVITGATSGLGRETARTLAKQGFPLILAVRDVAGGREQADALSANGTSVDVRHLDLADLSSVKSFSKDLLADDIIPQAIICNAGVQTYDRMRRSADRFELTMATNVMGHVILLEPLLKRMAPGSRVITLGSQTHRGGLRAFGFPGARWSSMDELLSPPDPDPNARDNGLVRYSTSKLACIAMAYEIDQTWRSRGVRAASFDPGLMPDTGLARNYPRIVQKIYSTLAPLIARIPGANLVKTSAENLAWLATSPDAELLMGHYVAGRKPRASSPLSYTPDLRQDVWQTSLERAGAALKNGPKERPD
ncbi:SDR family NAD(P)-dependent oxidoreductase [Kocuria carniphila]|uniref:SDR family NAD(P)-dependent oxidoreductase n=1 Tax=Kocuria carniphila TaxID=262208 RepID=UPI0021A3C7D1|nr:SDR family NAD(P)-dependent oxidoreductase [Kocuria carniphila]MCT1801408.1 SDR family NAD(P)-dependent oxidoreductase [Kocuria carniphila]